MTVLGETEANLRGNPGYRDALISMVDDKEPMVASGATWLLKSCLEKGGALSARQTAALIAALPSGEGKRWSAALHLCQCVRYLTLTDAGSKAEAETLWAWLAPLLHHTRPFVRAWSLDALAHLARAHDERRADFEAALQRASDDEAASVRARARQLG